MSAHCGLAEAQIVQPDVAPPAQRQVRVVDADQQLAAEQAASEAERRVSVAGTGALHQNVRLIPKERRAGGHLHRVDFPVESTSPDSRT